MTSMKDIYAANKILMKVGISPDLNGYHYLAEAISMVKESIQNNKVNDKFTYMYAQIGKKFNTTGSRVERAMRHAVEKAFTVNSPLLHDIFDSLIDYDSGKVVNSCFVCTLAQYLIMEEEI
jgi:two-component system response regulator (stage 0 sporulation protein A)